jgi:DNA-binding response OmpR family regulator
MSRRVLVIESDANVRGMMVRVLSLAGFAPIAVETVEAGEQIADTKELELAIIDEHPSHGGALDGVRAMRKTHPRLPIVLTGSLLPSRTLIELVRLRVDDVVQKPFTPAELSAAVRRVLERASDQHELAVEFSSAIAAVIRAIGRGQLDRARMALERARVSPLDDEAMALAALVAELAGEDRDADRGYRAAIALRDDEGDGGCDPHEGLARLATYGGARPVPRLDLEAGSFVYWLVDDVCHGLAQRPAPGGDRQLVAVIGLGLVPREPALYARQGGGQAFIVAPGTLDDVTLARVREVHGEGPEVRS